EQDDGRDDHLGDLALLDFVVRHGFPFQENWYCFAEKEGSPCAVRRRYFLLCSRCYSEAASAIASAPSVVSTRMSVELSFILYRTTPVALTVTVTAVAMMTFLRTSFLFSLRAVMSLLGRTFPFKSGVPGVTIGPVFYAIWTRRCLS